ncbi:MAG: hypothetical protein ABFD54_12825 [Armatimonadota bacterium]|nr:hypothetical protein [bacterium]
MNTNGSAGWFLIIPIGAILAFMGFGSHPGGTTADEPEEKVVTIGEYNQVRTGMTTGEVESIVGSSGEEAASGGDCENHCRIVSWQNSDGSNMIVTFQNGAVSDKAQSGL